MEKFRRYSAAKGGMRMALFSMLAATLSAVPTSEAESPMPREEDRPYVFVEGEELHYEVSWGGIGLGSITTIVHPSTVENGETRYNIEVRVQSYRSIPFVDVHFIVFSTMDSTFSSLGSSSLERQSRFWLGTYYLYDLRNRRVIVEEAQHRGLGGPVERRVVKDTLVVPDTRVQDGISLVHFARSNLRTMEALSVPTVSYGQVGYTQFDAGRRPTWAKIDALEKPVRVVELTGRLQLKGIFGVSGEYKGWFSDDAAAVPIKAEFRVILGSVKVELKEWKRPGWTPPM